MKDYGTTERTACPICGHGKIKKNHWRIPFYKTEALRVKGAKTENLPVLEDASKIYSWSQCQGCLSVFMDPYVPSGPAYRRRTTHAQRYENGRPIMEGGYLGRWQQISSYFKAGSTRFLDAACGAGQYLWLAHEDAFPWKELTGTELAEASVKAINEHGNKYGIRAHAIDLDEESLKLDKQDFIIFSEAFEHVEFPRTALGNLAQALTPGGRIYFTAQSPDGGLPIRPHEPIYTTKDGLMKLIKDLQLKTLLFIQSSGRWTVVGEK